MISLRHSEEVLKYGEYELLLPDHEQIYSYTRTLGEGSALVVLNWSEEPAQFEIMNVEFECPQAMYSNYAELPRISDRSRLRPYEAVVYRL